MTDPFRPSTWDEFIGQDALKSELAIRIAAAKAQGRPLPHILLHTVAGAGKTSLAHVIASELEEPLICVTCPITLKALTKIILSHNGCLLLDEVHRAGTRGQEDLLPLVLDGKLELPNGRSIEAEWLTIIAATTEPQKLIKPLVDRFDVAPPFDEYTDVHLGLIVQNMAAKVEVPMTAETAAALGKAALGVPRHARRFVMAYRDLLVGASEPPSAEDVLVFCRVADDGLSFHHQRLLQTLFDLGGTAGLRVLGNLLRLNEAVIEDLEQPLVKAGLLEYTERGRSLTRDGFARAKQGRAA